MPEDDEVDREPGFARATAIEATAADETVNFVEPVTVPREA